MIIDCDGKKFDVTAADSFDDHTFVRLMLIDADNGRVWRKEDIQRLANIALLVRPLVLRLREVLNQGR